LTLFFRKKYFVEFSNQIDFIVLPLEIQTETGAFYPTLMQNVLVGAEKVSKYPMFDELQVAQFFDNLYNFCHISLANFLAKLSYQ